MQEQPVQYYEGLHQNNWCPAERLAVFRGEAGGPQSLRDHLPTRPHVVLRVYDDDLRPLLCSTYQKNQTVLSFCPSSDFWTLCILVLHFILFMYLSHKNISLAVIILLFYFLVDYRIKLCNMLFPPMQGKLHDRYGHIVALSAKYLCLKMEFHAKVSHTANRLFSVFYMINCIFIFCIKYFLYSTHRRNLNVTAA